MPALRRVALAGAALAGFGFGAVAPASATTISVAGAYKAVITTVDTPLAGFFTVGDTVTFNFAYHDAANVGTPAVGDYKNNANGWVTFGTHQANALSATGSDVQVFNDQLATGAAGDELSILYFVSQDGDTPSTGGYAAIRANVQLFGPTSLFSTTDLPSAYLAASTFDSGKFFMLFRNNVGQSAFVAGSITGVAPIPAALPLFVTALAGLGCAGWRRRRTA